MDEADVIAAIGRAFDAVGARGDTFLDDAAVLPPLAAGAERVVTTDMAVEGIDFDRALHPLDSAGWRVVVQNLSDLAASGAVPVGFVWSLAVPAAWSRDALDELVRGAAHAAAVGGCKLLGGDLSRTDGPFACAVTMFGDVRGRRLARTGARVGDLVFLSRPTGASAAGLRALREGALREEALRSGVSGPRERALRAHLWPTAELSLGAALVGRATACIDVSDGLLLDLWRLARASGVAFDLTALDAAVDADAGATRADALGGGEDWALAFTLPAGGVPPAGAILLGAAREGQGLTEHGRALAPRGWDHFAT